MALVLTACTKEDQNQLSPSKGELVTDADEIYFPYEGGTDTINVVGGTAYVRAEYDGDEEWLTATRISGTTKASSYQVVVNKNTGEARTGYVLLNMDGYYKRVLISQEAAVVKPDTTYTFRTAGEIAYDMYPVWNFGNTFEASSADNLFTNNGGLKAEASWQPTMTTKAVVDAIKAAGFRSVRIPCAWIAGHISKGNASSFTIDPEWMARMKEVVNWCVDDGLYVVLNDHWDGGWLEELGFSSSNSSYVAVTDDQVEAKIATLKMLWTKIANEFQNYDEHLIFAGLNEPFQNYSLFNGRAADLTPILVKYNKAFVEAVRATGGNNANRILVVQAPGANIDYCVNYMPSAQLPEDAGKLMVEAHYYDPGQFCGTYSYEYGTGYLYWGSANHVQGSKYNCPSNTEESYMKKQMKKLYDSYTSKDYPVIIGEYACHQRNLAGTADEAYQAQHNASVKYWFECMNKYCVNYGIVPFAWDVNYVAGLNSKDGTMTIIDRANCKVIGENAMNGILDGAAGATWKEAK